MTVGGAAAVEAGRVPVTVLTGFLGAGKTTLLNHILRGEHGLRVAVLVNDFGAINIDAELVVGIEDEVVSLANGCVCCTIRDDLVAAVLAAIERPERPEYVLLEASGVADPTALVRTFNNPGLERLRLDAVLCVVDAEQVFGAPEHQDLKLYQMACADMVVLNKVDLVGPEEVERIRAWLDERFHRYRLVQAVRGDVPLPVLLSVGHDVEPARTDHDHERNHAEDFSTWAYETDLPMSLEALRDAASRLPGDVYRAKGVVHAKEAPDRRAVLQVVGRRVELELGDEWGARTPRTRIVAIGVSGAVSPAVLGPLFDSCTASGGGR